MTSIAYMNESEYKSKVIKNTFPIKVNPNYIPKKDLNEKKFSFKILQPALATYQISPTVSIKNEKVQLLLDNISDSYKEFYQMSNQLKITEKGIQLPTQSRFFFETVINNKEYKNFVTFPEQNDEEMIQNLNFTWHKASKIKTEPNVFTINKNCIAYEFSLKYTSALSLSIDQRLKEKPMRELLEQGKMLKDGEEIFIQFGIKPAEFDWWKEGEKRLDTLLKRIKYTESTKSKITYPAFDSCLRIIIKGESIHRSEMLARGTVMAFKQLNGDNELVEHKIKPNKLKKWFTKMVEVRKIKTHLFRFNKRMLLTRKEIRHFIKLPERNLQLEFDLGINEREELKVDKLLTNKNGVLIGHSEEKGKRVEIRLPIHNLDTLMSTNIFNGSPRMGKDTAVINTIVEFANTINAGAFVPDVIDEKGNGRGMADSLRDSILPEKIIDLNLGDYSNPIYFGLEDVAKLIGVNGMNVIADNFVKILDLGETTESQELCSLIARVCKCNIYDMYCCLKSKSFAESMYELVKEEDELLAMEYFHEFLNVKRDKAINTVKTRLKMILGNPHFKHMMAQDPNPNIDFEKWIRERKVVLLRMKKMDIGDIGVRILMYLISMKVFWIKKVIQTDDPTLIIFNEPHQFMSDGFQEIAESMMAESPKYRLCINWIFHDSQQLPKKLWELMKASSSNYFIFKNTNRRMYVDLEQQLKPIEIDTAMKTEKHESIFIPFIDGKTLEPIFVKMLPPPIKRMKPFDNEYLTIEHAKLYGRSVTEVREKIMETEIGMYSEEKSA